MLSFIFNNELPVASVIIDIGEGLILMTCVGRLPVGTVERKVDRARVKQR